MPLPTDTRGKAAGSSFTTLDQGQTKLLIVGEAVSGYQYWTNDGVKTQADVFDETPGIRMKKVKDKNTGVESEVPDKQQFFWAVPVYNFKSEAFEIYKITQKGVREDLAALQANDEWGDPVGKYTITITKTGQSFDTAYTVTPNPTTDANKEAIAAVMAKYEPQDLAAIIF